jgi:hypothetical protein
VVTESSSRASLPTSDLQLGQDHHPIGVPSPLGWMGNRRVPVKIVHPMLPRMMR